MCIRDRYYIYLEVTGACSYTIRRFRSDGISASILKISGGNIDNSVYPTQPGTNNANQGDSSAITATTKRLYSTIFRLESNTYNIEMFSMTSY